MKYYGGATLKYKDIITLAKKVKSNVENKQTASVDNVRNYTTLAYLFSAAILRAGRDTGIKRIRENKKKVGYPIEKNINKKDYLNACKWYVQWCDNHNNTAPSYVKLDKGINIWVWTYATAKILIYYSENKALPNYVYTTNKYFRKNEETYTDKIFNLFVSKFGKVNTIDEALGKIQGLGYGFYYDDHMTNVEVINNLANPNADKPNCTDVSQMLWHIAKKLGYDVRAIHVWCNTSNVGHIRLQFRHVKHTNGYWINRDGACVINGGGITEIWCSNGTYLATNPDWFMENLNR